MIGSAVAPGTLLFMQSLVGWRGAFVCAAALGIIATLILALQGEPPPRHRTTHVSRPRSDDPSSAAADGWRLLLSPPILLNLRLLRSAGNGRRRLKPISGGGLGALYGTPPALANTALTGLLVMSAIGVLVEARSPPAPPSHPRDCGRIAGDGRGQHAHRFCGSRRAVAWS